MVVNKLNLNADDRQCFYRRGYIDCIGEVRQFDPITGFILIYDYFREETIEMIYDHTTNKYRGTGDTRLWTCDWNIDNDEIPTTNKTEIKVTARTLSRL